MREKTHTFEYTKEVIQKLYNEAQNEMTKFEEPNPLLEDILNRLIVA
jgi:hypothetical protein